MLGDSDNKMVMENVNKLNDEILVEGSLIVPEVGMKFKDEKEVFEFYKRYAYNVGFPVGKRNSKKGDDGIVKLYRCNRELSARVKRKLEVDDIAGISLHKSFNSAVVEASGYEKMTCVEKDCRNYIDNVRRLRLGEGDAAAIQAYFFKM
ncbi:Protein FAR1-RELATED SEQUENCE [Abeliophyllum distichum]|uniref:Protein FAR1-RELATED SEQUENCE n=1 Tax=Abeliophyllum distichum TaxID=126358 RepID=A0ABD1RI11_9LAMI